MKLASKMVTEQDTRFYRELAIPTPYGNFPMIPEEVVYDEDSDFYLYYIHWLCVARKNRVCKCV